MAYLEHDFLVHNFSIMYLVFEELRFLVPAPIFAARRNDSGDIPFCRGVCGFAEVITLSASGFVAMMNGLLSCNSFASQVLKNVQNRLQPKFARQWQETAKRR